MPISTGYAATLLTVIAAYGIAALGLNITMGRAGQVNLGQAAFVGVGAMASAIATVRYSLSFWEAIIIAALASFLAGAALGVVSIRLREDFLAITTIGFNFIVVYVFLYYKFFGGSYGIIGIPKPTLLGMRITGFAYTIMSWTILLLLAALALYIDKTWLGLAFEALRDNEEVAESVGIDVRKYKILAFAIGAMYGGVAGSILAHFKGYIVYSDFAFPYSIMILSMSIVGGMDTIVGAIVGSAMIILLPEIFRPLMEYRMIMYTAIIVLMLYFKPEGLLGRESKWLISLRRILRAWSGGIRGD